MLLSCPTAFQTALVTLTSLQGTAHVSPYTQNVARVEMSSGPSHNRRPGQLSPWGGILLGANLGLRPDG